MPGSTVDDAADELYSLTPREFTEARDARAKELKAAGDSDAAREVMALRKPTVAAWLANQLVRQHRDEVAPLLELGAGLREATATLSGPQLRELSRQRNQVVQALVQRARRIAADAGAPVSQDVARAVTDTLNAALADESAGELLLQGRLTEPLEHSGFGASSGTAKVAAPRRANKPAKTAAREPTAAERRRAERRAQLEADLAEAWAAARAAADARVVAEGGAVAAERAAGEAGRRVEALRSELETAADEQDQADRAHQAAGSTREAARAEAEQATRRVSALQRELDALGR